MMVKSVHTYAKATRKSCSEAALKDGSTTTDKSVHHEALKPSSGFITEAVWRQQTRAPAIRPALGQLFYVRVCVDLLSLHLRVSACTCFPARVMKLQSRSTHQVLTSRPHGCSVSRQQREGPAISRLLLQVCLGERGA